MGAYKMNTTFLHGLIFPHTFFLHSLPLSFPLFFLPSSPSSNSKLPAKLSLLIPKQRRKVEMGGWEGERNKERHHHLFPTHP